MRFDNEAPLNWPLTVLMLMVILRRQCIPESRYCTATTALTSIDSRVWGQRARRMQNIKFRSILLRQIVSIFVVRHSRPQFP